ncbi:hypothetical protein B0H12DRAFT_1145098 [Mycena haematopus]|nr:hypothetical protein B0H12DRAFT_1145098 [Mycena haematopus]
MDEPPAKTMIMEFATNSVRNTTLTTTDDDLYYEVVTRFWHPYITKINKLDPASRIMTTVSHSMRRCLQIARCDLPPIQASSGFLAHVQTCKAGGQTSNVQ